MNFKDLFAQIYCVSNPIEKFVELRLKLGSSKVAKSDNDAIKLLVTAISRNRQGRALTMARVILLSLGADKAVKRIQREGCFRPSQLDFSNLAGQVVIADWIKHAAVYGFCPSSIRYLNSIAALWLLAPELNKLRRSLISRLEIARPRAIKTLMAMVDTSFSFGYGGSLDQSTEFVEVHSSEHLAEAFSYLLRLFHKEFGLKSVHFGLVDSEDSKASFYKELLNDAMKICAYLEAEVLVESFPYSVKVVDGEITISAINSLLEKSVRLGYVQANMQIDVRIKSLNDAVTHSEKGLSRVRFAEKCYSKMGNDIIELILQPVPRYRMKTPNVPQWWQIFAEDSLFLEDLWSLSILGIEDYVEPEDIITSPVVGNITVMDILKLQRFFAFLLYGMKMSIDKHFPKSERSLLWLNSCLPVFKKTELITIIQKLVGEEKVMEMLRLLTCDISSDYVDLQYTPLIEANNYFMFSMTVLTNSNLVRNLLCHHEKRLTMRDGSADPMQEALRSALQQAGFLVDTEVNMGPKSNPLEVDILACKDGHLFLFECKNSFHPCNIFEMRTSYEHISKAASQLALRKKWLLDPENQTRVFRKLNWNVSGVCSVNTCIALGNRVFNGYNFDDHPVRQVHELLNILLGGFVILNGVNRRIWKNEAFSVLDLCAYLQGEIIIGDFLASMLPFERAYFFNSKKLTFSSYVLDLLQLKTISEARYPEIEEHALKALADA